MGVECQPEQPFVIAVAGVAGSGKSTLGRALARLLRVPMLDLDTVTNPLLDRLGDAVFGGHWLASRHAPAIREGRYAAVYATAVEVLETTSGAVLVAPFTQELTGGPAWERLQEALAPAPVRVVHLVGSSELFAARRAARGHDRDLHRVASATPTKVSIPVVSVKAASSPSKQLEQVKRELDLDGRVC